MSESESPPHTRLLQELDRVHRESIFPVLFEHLSFDMVASFECGIARQNGVVLLKSTTFWMSHDRDPGWRTDEVCIRRRVRQTGGIDAI